MNSQRCAFPERLFEFAFNAEYAKTHEAVIVGTPDIPSQDAEKWLGYDVAFEVRQGSGVTGSLALQHKVPRWTGGPGSSKNSHIRQIAGPSYFTFPLDVEQFNLIEDLSSAKLPGIEFYFCAPLFVRRGEMQAYYGARAVEAQSIWIDVAGIGPLDPTEAHSIVYLADGSAAWVFSETPSELKVISPAKRDADRTVDEAWLTTEVFHIYTAVRSRVPQRLPPNDRDRLSNSGGDTDFLPGPLAAVQAAIQEAPTPTDGRLRATLQATAFLLADRLNMSWLVEIAQ